MKKIAKKNRDLQYYLSLDYPCTIEKYEEDGESRLGLQVPDLPGVWADGSTIEEAYTELMETKRIWFETCLDKGIDIPEPVSEQDFSGKFILRLDPKLHMSLSKDAARNKRSLNQHVRALLEKQISSSEIMNEIKTLKELFITEIDSIKTELSAHDYRIMSLEGIHSAGTSVAWPSSGINQIVVQPTKDWPTGIEIISPSEEEDVDKSNTPLQ
jgi:predicted HicB family RNase H-like nuclease